jgi:hypothetical protein
MSSYVLPLQKHYYKLCWPKITTKLEALQKKMETTRQITAIRITLPTQNEEPRSKLTGYLYKKNEAQFWEINFILPQLLLENLPLT